MRPFSSLFTKILLWFFLNLILVSVVLIVFFSLQPHIDLWTLFGLQTSDQMRIAGSLISHDLSGSPKAKWPDILERYGKIYQVDFALALELEGQVFPKDMDVPDGVIKMIADVFQRRPAPGPPPGPPPPPIPHEPDKSRIPLIMNDSPRFSDHEPHHKPPRLIMRTKKPTRYWTWIPMPLFPQPSGPPVQAVLLAVSESMTGNGFFFNPNPVIIAAIIVILISVLFWIPLVKNITRPLARMTLASEEIAKGMFDIRIEHSRADEIGRLAGAINHMSSRLYGFVKGQKRFLGDVAHELGSPLARIHLGLGILERNVDPENQKRVADVIEDVNHLSNLVNELLSFSRAEMNPAKVRMQRAKLLPLVNRAVHRETMSETDVIVQVDPGTKVVADPELLTRALANILRNSVKYAGKAGPIHISTRRGKDAVMIEVRDAGPGVPEDLVEQLFDPFFRPEASRDRESGGVGLGLAIVKTCVETCKGSVSAKNLKPQGFAVTITLPG